MTILPKIWKCVAVALVVSGRLPSRQMAAGESRDRMTAPRYVWDLTGTGRAPGAAAVRLSADVMGDGLADNDATKAHTAYWELTDRGEQSVALLRDRLKPVQAADEATVGRLLAALDAEAFADREAAAKSLSEMEDTAIPALRAALKTRLSAEVRSRVEHLLAAAAAPVASSGRGAQQVRAIAVSQRIGSKSAQTLLEELASGLAEARLTREAIEALESFPQPPPEPKLQILASFFFRTCQTRMFRFPTARPPSRAGNDSASITRKPTQ